MKMTISLNEKHDNCIVKFVQDKVHLSFDVTNLTIIFGLRLRVY